MLVSAQPELRSEDLLLRPFCAEDAAQVQLLAGDRLIADTTDRIPHPYPDGAAEQWIATLAPDWNRGVRAVYAITLASSGELAGCVGLESIAGSQAELGYWVGVPWWGRGIATCAAGAAVEFGGSVLGLEQIQARVLTRNPASARVLLRLGFECLGEGLSVCGFERREQMASRYELRLPRSFA